MARILVLGAAGFFGSHVTRVLAHDHEVFRVGRSPRTDDDWRPIDIATAAPEALDRLLADTQPDAIVNCVGAMGGSFAHLVRSNVLVVARLIDALAARHESARLVHIGSAAEYGVPTERVPLPETAAAHPVSAYGISKLAGSQLALAARRDGRAETVVLRVFNPVGPLLPISTLPGRAAERMREALLAHRNEIHLGPLGAYRDYVDVRDVASAVKTAALEADPPPDLINIGSGHAVQVRALVAALGEVSGFGGAVVEGEAGSDRSKDVPWIAADTALAQRALRWRPAYDLRDSLVAQWESFAA